MIAVDSPLVDFGVAVSFADGRAVLVVRGELDMLSAPELAGVLDAVIDRGHRHVVIDVADVAFMDAAGLGVIAGGVKRLATSGGVLTLRSPLVMVRRMLAITGLDEFVAIEDPSTGSDRLGAEQPAQGDSARVEGAAPAHRSRQVTAIPADHDVVDGALRLVVALARATVGAADGVSVSLSRHGQLSTVAASDRTISEMDADQYATGEGPCVDASVEGRWFHVTSLDEETRWPSFIPRARTLGINAILSNPLLAKDRPVGALNIYSRTTGAFSAEDQQLAAVFAEQASIILGDAGSDVSDEELVTRIAEAQRSRQVIAQAQGVLMEREHLDEEGAYASLRRSSLLSNLPLRERAEDMVASTQGSPGGQASPASPGSPAPFDSPLCAGLGIERAERTGD